MTTCHPKDSKLISNATGFNFILGHCRFFVHPVLRRFLRKFIWIGQSRISSGHQRPHPLNQMIPTHYQSLISEFFAATLTVLSLSVCIATPLASPRYPLLRGEERTLPSVSLGTRRATRDHRTVPKWPTLRSAYLRMSD